MDIETIALPFTLTMFSLVCTLPDVSFGFIFLMFFTVFVICFVSYHVSHQSQPTHQLHQISFESMRNDKLALETAFKSLVEKSTLDCSETGAGTKMTDKLECRVQRNKAIDAIWIILNKKYPVNTTYEEKQAVILETFEGTSLKPWKNDLATQS